MVGFIPKLPSKAWANIMQWTVGTTLVTTFVSLIVACAIMWVFNGFVDIPGVLTALILPIVLTPGIVISLSVRHQKLALANATLHQLAYNDSMLDCMNRRGFTSTLDIGLQYASPHRPCALLIIDVDNFKQVNDRFGHDRGDQALQSIAKAIKSAIRTADVLGRIGGEEFGAFLPGTDEAHARIIAERICEAVAATRFAPDGHPHSLSVSVGGAIATEVTQFSTLYRAADQRLYAAKQGGRNRASFERAVDMSTLPASPPASKGTAA